MPYRKTILAQDEIYHVFNRGVARLPIFLSVNNYHRFLQLVDYYRFTNTPASFSDFMKVPVDTRDKIWDSLRKEHKLYVEILAFCLMPNHFHILLKQISEKGVTTFMGNLQNSYVKYFNTKKDRVGPLFQSAFKAVRIETNEQLLHVARYIHLNPSTGYLVNIDQLIKYPWSSLPVYLDQNPQGINFIATQPILSFFKTIGQYKEFVLDQAKYQRELDSIKHLTLE